MIVGTTAHSRSAWARSSAPSMSWVGRHPSSAPEQRHRRAQDLERRASLRHLRQHRRQAAGQARAGRPPRRRIAAPVGPVGELSFEQQVPHVLERSPRRQVDRRVLAVVEEALLAADVAQRGLRRHDPLEPGGDLGPVLVGGAQPRHAHEVAQRHHADELVAVDHRQVPVLVMRQAGPGGVDLLVGPEHVGVGRHPHLDGLGAGRRHRRGRPQQVALGQDAGDLGRVR